MREVEISPRIYGDVQMFHYKYDTEIFFASLLCSSEESLIKYMFNYCQQIQNNRGWRWIYL